MCKLATATAAAQHLQMALSKLLALLGWRRCCNGTSRLDQGAACCHLVLLQRNPSSTAAVLSQLGQHN